MAIAFFDFDGTLTLRDSTALCLVPSIRMRLVTPARGLQIATAFVGHRLNLYPRTSAHRLAFRCYDGWTRAEIRDGVRLLHERYVRPWYSAPMREKVEEHRRRGDVLVVATATADFFPVPLADNWGFDHVIGTRMCYENDTCTGLVDGAIVDGAEKHRVALDYARRLGVSLKDCTFYSDHIADLPLLESVGRAVTVGPHRPLVRVALARGWPIIAQHALPS